MAWGKAAGPGGAGDEAERAGAGPKSAGLPLCWFQASHRKNRDMVNTTHKMVRRISVMENSLIQVKNGLNGPGAWQQAPTKSQTLGADCEARRLVHLHTRGGNARFAAPRGSFPPRHHGDPEPEARSWHR